MGQTRKKENKDKRYTPKAHVIDKHTQIFRKLQMCWVRKKKKKRKIKNRNGPISASADM